MTAIREEEVLAALRDLETARREEVLDFIDDGAERGKLLVKPEDKRANEKR